MDDNAFASMLDMLKKAAKTSKASIEVPDVSRTPKNNFEIVREGLQEMKEKR